MKNKLDSEVQLRPDLGKYSIVNIEDIEIYQLQSKLQTESTSLGENVVYTNAKHLFKTNTITIY